MTAKKATESDKDRYVVGSEPLVSPFPAGIAALGNFVVHGYVRGGQTHSDVIRSLEACRQPPLRKDHSLGFVCSAHEQGRVQPCCRNTFPPRHPHVTSIPAKPVPAPQATPAPQHG